MAPSFFRMFGLALRLRCPRCGDGRLYQKPFRMLEGCPRCALKYEREQGYFVGAMYINYGATVGIAVPGYLLLDTFTRMTIHQQLALWVPFAIIFPLLFFHHARSLWLAIDHYFNPAPAIYSVPDRRSGDD